MSTPPKQRSPIGQGIFFETIETAGSNRPALALVALSLANADDGRRLLLSRLLNRLRWDEYQTMLAMLSLKAHCPIYWDDDQLATLKSWATEEFVNDEAE